MQAPSDLAPGCCLDVRCRLDHGSGGSSSSPKCKISTMARPILRTNLTYCYSEVVNLDNHDKERSGAHPDRIISSKIIVEDFGGVDTILQKLFTNPKVSASSDLDTPDVCKSRIGSEQHSSTIVEHQTPPTNLFEFRPELKDPQSTSPKDIDCKYRPLRPSLSFSSL